MHVSSAFVVSITPFTATGALDEAGLRAHLRRLRASGIGVYLGGSGSGEGNTLSPAEVRRVLEIGSEELSGRVTVRAMGREPRTAAEMIELGGVVADIGLDGMQVYPLDPGHGARPKPAELERYYTDVLDQVDVPLALSTHQSVGYMLPVELIDRLLDRYDRIVGVHCATDDMRYLVELVQTVDGRADVHVGGPMHALTCLALGGQGYLSSDANLVPHLCVEVVRRWDAADLPGCARAFRDLLAVFTANVQLGGVVATKAALQLAGLPGGWPRLPRLPLADELLPSVQRLLVDQMAHLEPKENIQSDQ